MDVESCQNQVKIKYKLMKVNFAMEFTKAKES